MFLLFLFYLLFVTINSSFLEVYENDTSTLIYKIQTPIFDLGSHNVPLKAGVIITNGCGGIGKVDDSAVQKAFLGTNWSKLIVLIESNTDDNSCLPVSHIIPCQERYWCGGVLTQELFYNPAGLGVWSVFDVHRPRSAYKVPLVQASLEDFAYLKDALLNAQKNNQSHAITLTSDDNPWLVTINSFFFLFYFQILTPIWSIGCITLATKALMHQKTKGPKKFGGTLGTIYFGCSSFWGCSTPGLKDISLRLHIFTHLSRIAFITVDPFLSRQIYSHSVYFMGLYCAISFEIATNILLSFSIRELTGAKFVIDVMKKTRVAFAFILIFLILDFIISLTGGLKIQLSSGPIWIVKAFFYIVMNILLGIWYFIQGYKFLKKCARINKGNKEKLNQAKQILIQISMINSVGLILFGLIMVLTIQRDFFGAPVGNFITFALLLAVVQLSSFFEILIFARIPFSLTILVHSIRYMKSNFGSWSHGFSDVSL